MHPSEIPLNVLAEAGADGIILIDDQSTILFANPSLEQIFGYERTEIVGNNLTSLMPEHLRQLHLTSLGIGFDVMMAQKGASLGLLGMRERVTLMGGEFDYNSAPGRGTEVHASFPLRSQPNTQEPTP